MPRLLLFAPCERVITDEQGNVSLIVLLSAIRIGLNLAEIPQKAVIPMRWDIITMWWRSPEDSGAKFEQHVELVSPDEKVLITNTAKFGLVEADTHRHVARIQGFPMPRLAGRCFLRLYVREDREGIDRGEPVAIYPLTVEVDLQAPKENE